jgi:hypothetical protein
MMQLLSQNIPLSCCFSCCTYVASAHFSAVLDPAVQLFVMWSCSLLLLPHRPTGTAAAAAAVLLLLLLLLHQVRDPRVPASANDTFLDMLESYFSRCEEEKQAEARPDLAYQVRPVFHSTMYYLLLH